MKPQQKEKSTPPQPAKQNTPAIRRIPQTLVQSYDLITLKQQRKKRFKKTETIQQQGQHKMLLNKIRPIYGSCFCWYEGDHEMTETVYQLSTTSLVLSKFDIISVKNVTKIKFKMYEIEQALNSKNHQQTVTKTKNKVVKLNWSEDNETQYVIFIQPTTPEEAYFLFSAIITRQMMIKDFVIHDISTEFRANFDGAITKIEGQIPKLSNYLKKWQRRKIVLQQNSQLHSFKQGKCTFTIKSIKQLWTRFDMHNGYLIVKVHHGIEKTQIGIPLVDYTNIVGTKNWLYMLGRMIR